MSNQIQNKEEIDNLENLLNMGKKDTGKDRLHLICF